VDYDILRWLKQEFVGVCTTMPLNLTVFVFFFSSLGECYFVILDIVCVSVCVCVCY